MIEQAPILAFDTCGAVGSVALAKLENATEIVTCLSQVELPAKTSAAQLMPAIASLLREAELALDQLRAIVVVHGPGSFTGVRVGVSTAKGLAQVSGLPVAAVSRLAVLAMLSGRAECLALLEAGRGEFYAGRSHAGQRRQEWLASPEQVKQAAQSGEHLVVAETTTAARVAEWQPQMAGPLDAGAAVRAAGKRLLAEDWDDMAALDANYLRQSDAELFARASTGGA